MQIFRLRWMMQNIRLFNVCERLFRDILKNPNVLHYPVKAKNLNSNPYIYILYYQSNNALHPNPLVTLIKW